MPFFKLVLLSLGLFSTIQGYNWSSVEDKIQYYLGNGAFPGGILRVANSTHNIYTSTFGSYTHITSPSATPPFTNNTMFDIASLTKVSATLTCIMHLY